MNNNEINEECRVDLHGMKHEDVDEVCHRFLNENWLSNKEGHIITGNSRQMKQIVIRILKQYDISFEEACLNNTGYFRVWFE